MRLIILFVFTSPFTIHGQLKVPAHDSIKIKDRVEGFYSWYSEIVKDGTVTQKLNPVFARRNDGMTTLDFTNYRAGLKAHGFTDRLTENTVRKYRHCIKNLSKIPFDEFSRFNDLVDLKTSAATFKITSSGSIQWNRWTKWFSPD
jgi:hypothetical protein